MPNARRGGPRRNKSWAFMGNSNAAFAGNATVAFVGATFAVQSTIVRMIGEYIIRPVDTLAHELLHPRQHQLLAFVRCPHVRANTRVAASTNDNGGVPLTFRY